MIMPFLYNLPVTNECEPNPCQNGATCYDGFESYNCTCAPGYTGDNCQTSNKYFAFVLLPVS